MRPIKVLEKLRFFSPSLVHSVLQITNNTIRTDDRFMEIFWQLVREDRMLLSIREAYNIYFYLSKTLTLDGAVAELGVYKGGGAKLIAEFKSDLPLHLFDTFEGMPAVDENIDHHNEGDFSDTNLKSVRNYLKKYQECYFHKGLFPDTTRELPEDIAFSFVHLDVDIYSSTLSGLKYFYPRLKKEGVIISHDYKAISCPGVKKAFDEYFVDKNEEVIHLWDTQCIVRKQS